MSGCAAACDPSSAASQVLGLQVGASMPGWQGRGLVNGVNKRTVFQQRLALLHHCSLALCFFSVFFFTLKFIYYLCVSVQVCLHQSVCASVRRQLLRVNAPLTLDSRVARLAGQVSLLLSEFTNHASCFLILLQKDWVEMLSNYDRYTQT